MVRMLNSRTTSFVWGECLKDMKVWDTRRDHLGLKLLYRRMHKSNSLVPRKLFGLTQSKLTLGLAHPVRTRGDQRASGATTIGRWGTSSVNASIIKMTKRIDRKKTSQ